MEQVLDGSPIFSALSSKVPLRRYGYEVLRHGGSFAQFLELKQMFSTLLRQRLETHSGKNFSALECEWYHDLIDRNGVDHHSFIKATSRKLPAEMIQHLFLRRLVEVSGEHVGRRLRVYKDTLEYRVVRPNHSDNNPWHRDHWFPYFIPLLNVYLPISGSFVDSSLQVVPGSHLWTDQECVPTFPYDGGKTNRGGILYSVPEVKESTRPLIGHRMDILPGDFALFSPRMVHGEGSNASPETRFSFEFRLEVAP